MSKSKKKATIERSYVSPPVSITSPGAMELLSLVPSITGAEVTPHSIYQIPTVLHGVDLIASTIGRIDCCVYKEAKDGTKARDKEHAADYLLMRRPNDWQTPFEFRREIAADAIMGNSYIFVARDDNTAKPTDLIILDPHHTWPVVVRYPDNVAKMKVYYVTEINGKDIILGADEVVHVKGRVREDCGLIGRSLLNCAKQILGLSISVIEYGAYYFQNSGLPSLIVEAPTFMRDKQQLEQFMEGINGGHKGIRNSNKTMLLQGGAKATRQQISNDDAQFLDSRQMTLTDVSLLLGLPGSFLGSKQNVSYGSLEQDSLNLLVHTFSQWFTNFEQAFDRLLMTEIEIQRGSRWIEFNKQQLLEADHNTAVTTWANIVNNGFALPNDACAALSLPPMDEEFNKPRLLSTVKVQGEEPPPPPMPPPVPAENQGKDATGPDKGKDAQTKLRSLTEAVLRRFVGRLERSQGKDLDHHRDILVETLAPISDQPEEQADAFLDVVRTELESVLPEQVGAVLKKLDIKTFAGRILR